MEYNLEKLRSRAHFVGEVDLFCIACQVMTIIGISPIGLVVLYEQYYNISEGVLIYIAYSALILFAFVAVNFYATSKLLKASSRNEIISPEKSLSLCHFWFPLNIFFLIIGILLHLIMHSALHSVMHNFAFQSITIMALVIGVPVRFFMLKTVKNYMDALKRLVSENNPHRDLRLYAIFSALNTNEFQEDIV